MDPEQLVVNRSKKTTKEGKIKIIWNKGVVSANHGSFKEMCSLVFEHSSLQQVDFVEKRKKALCI